MLRRSPYGRANGSSVLGRGLINERNSEIPLYVGSDSTGIMRVSQRVLESTYPVFFDALQRSGNQVIDPVRRISPRFTSIFEHALAEEGMELVMSTLEPQSCHDPHCPDFVTPPVLKRLQDRMQYAIRQGDPMIYDEVVHYLGLMNAFASLHSLQDPHATRDYIASQIYPHRHQKGIGLGPRLDPMIREMALRFMPMIAAAGPGQIYEHLLNHHRMTGNDTMMLERLIENLRIDEQVGLYLIARHYAMEDGDISSWKILRILEGLPIDRASFRQWIHEMGGI